MNFKKNPSNLSLVISRSQKFFFLLAISSIFTFNPKCHSQATAAKPVENRFLFVVETTLTMNRSAKATRDLVEELVSSGAHGQMKAGDTFSLWTYNEKLNTQFPLQKWDPEQSKPLAAATVNFLKQRRFEKKSVPSIMLGPVYSVIKASKAITIILISTGNEPIVGTPFDAQINTFYRTYAAELRKAKIPFITVLLGRNGKLASYTVISSVRPFQIPNLPMPEPPLAKTNPPIKSVSASTNRPIPVKRYAKENIIISKSVPTNLPVLSPTNVAPPIELKSEIPEPTKTGASTNSLAILVEAPPVSEKPSPLVQPSLSTNATASNTKTLLSPEVVSHDDAKDFRTQPQTVEFAPTNSLVVPLVATQTTVKSRKLALIGSAVLFFAIVVLSIIIRNSRKSSSSLISRSMDRR